MNRTNDTDLREALRRRELKRPAVQVPDDFSDRLMQRIEKPRHRRLWLYSAIGAVAASLLVLVMLDYNDVEQMEARGERQEVRGERQEVRGERQEVRGERIAPASKTALSPLTSHPSPQETALSPLTSHLSPQETAPSQPNTAAARPDTMPAENLEYYIARLEAEMDALDDSVNAAHLEQLIAADVRLQQLVSRIVGKQAQQALNEILNDSTANYINF